MRGGEKVEWLAISCVSEDNVGRAFVKAERTRREAIVVSPIVVVRIVRKFVMAPTSIYTTQSQHLKLLNPSSFFQNLTYLQDAPTQIFIPSLPKGDLVVFI